jgi:hypothetical protein
MRPDFEPDPGIDPVTQPEPPDPLCQDPSGHAWLDAARVFQPPCPHAGLAAIAVLSDAGLRALRRSGHAAIAAACVPSVAPARVRFVDPTAAIDIASCAETALPGLYDAPWPELPVILGCEPAGELRARFKLRIPPDLHALRGHFPDLPIVPGAIHVGWALVLARRAFRVPGSLSEMPAVKFRRIVQPGHELSLSLEWQEERRLLSFSLASNSGPHSAGRLVMGPPDA